MHSRCRSLSEWIVVDIRTPPELQQKLVSRLEDTILLHGLPLDIPIGFKGLDDIQVLTFAKNLRETSVVSAAYPLVLVAHFRLLLLDAISNAAQCILVFLLVLCPLRLLLGLPSFANYVLLV